MGARRAVASLGVRMAVLPAVCGVPVILVVTLGPAVMKFVQVLLPVVH